MKRISVFFLALGALLSTSAFNQAKADEGMWLPSMVKDFIEDMQSKGFKLSAEDIYSVNQACLKDAVVHFGGGCTGELISPEGLLITNHHCGYSYIQYHSSVEHDYLKDGFWAMKRSEELPCPGLFVSFLERMEDVTDRVLKGVTPGMSEEERDSIVKTNTKAIREEAKAGREYITTTLAPIYYGNQYILYVFRRYDDVRFVGAPPSSIGKFGGETDNWMWPRHTGDFSLFRIYSKADGTPSKYSEENVPYTPAKFFEISTKGVKEGDFTFVYGYPGRTNEYITGSAVNYTANVSNPAKIALRTIRLNIMDKYMDASQAVRIQYSAKKASVANSWKKWQGESLGVSTKKVLDRKAKFEAEFKTWAKGTEYEGVIEKLDSLQAELDICNFERDCYREALRCIEWPAFVASGKRDSAAFFKNYYQPIDQESFIALVTEFGNLLPKGRRPAYYDEMLANFGSVQEWMNAVYTDEAQAAEFSSTFAAWSDRELTPKIDALSFQINVLMRTYMRGQMAFQPQKTFYPDANSTLRVAYGKVSGYDPKDGVHYEPVSTIKGIIEKDNPEIFDYNIPQSLRDIESAKDFGRWATPALDGSPSVAVCFLATNHTTGGNSGSPIINEDGRLIGINFDRVWEGTMSDIAYDKDICRNISLDIRYALFVIDKVAGASHLLEEMTLAD